MWVPRPRARSLLVVGVCALVLSGVGAVLGNRPPAPPGPVAAAPAPAGDRLSAAIGRAQERLKLLPGDYVTWAALGSAYLERARITADPAYYPKAEGALQRALSLRPDSTDAMTVLGALANARHDFAGGRAWAERAVGGNPYHA